MKAGIAGYEQVGELRDAMTDELVSDGMVSSPTVEAAFRRVPRHAFVPSDTSLDDAYSTTVAPITKVDENGAHLSSVSAPWLQAMMIGQAGICAGMKVLEVGSGGYNAALLAEVTGPQGLVVTMDIDPEVTARSVDALDATGYGGRVIVVTADGEHGMPAHAPYDAIIVTAGAWEGCGSAVPSRSRTCTCGSRPSCPASAGWRQATGPR